MTSQPPQRLTRTQRKTRAQFGKFLASLTLEDLARQETQQSVMSALTRMKQADQDAVNAAAAQAEMFPGHDMRAWKENLIQPSLMRI